MAEESRQNFVDENIVITKSGLINLVNKEDLNNLQDTVIRYFQHRKKYPQWDEYPIEKMKQHLFDFLMMIEETRNVL